MVSARTTSSLSAGCYPVGAHTAKSACVVAFQWLFNSRATQEDHLFITLPFVGLQPPLTTHHETQCTPLGRVPQPALPLSPCASTDAPRRPQPATQRNGPYTAHTARTALHPAPPDLLDPQNLPKTTHLVFWPRTLRLPMPAPIPLLPVPMPGRGRAHDRLASARLDTHAGHHTILTHKHLTQPLAHSMLHDHWTGDACKS